MINRQLQTLHPEKRVLQFMLNVSLVACKLPTQVGSDQLCLFFIRYQTDPPENDHAVHIQRPFTFLAVSGIPDTIAGFIALGDGVNLVPGFAPWK